jgi:hypothetical protein
MTALQLPVTILKFTPGLAPDFYRLDAEWLERFFRLESMDEEVLRNPVKYIVKPGGEVLFAQKGADIVGTCALMPSDAG